MKRNREIKTFDRAAWLAVVVGLLAMAALLPAAHAREQKGTAARGAAASIPVPIPQSQFDMPNNPSEGKDPFFPKSNHCYPTPGTRPTPVAQSTLVELKLNGLTGPPRRSCMINGETFLAGDQASVKDLKNPGAKMPIKCLEIKDNSVVIQIISTGERRELHLAPGAAP
jgi:hypothetical protein